MKRKMLFLSVSLLIASMAFACFWDYDTVEMERQQFPSVIELLSGNFLRHSEECHFWRIRDREQRLKEDSNNLELLDDLAVSYSKTGNDEKAIEIGLSQLTINGDRYETLANLGTFHIHNGDLLKGIEYIDKAIAINPAAHFGREIFQRHLAEYVLSKTVNGKIPLPLSSNFSKYPDAPLDPQELSNFYSFLVEKKIFKTNSAERIYKLEPEELQEAVIGVMGMMKFGNSESPILSEVLGDLLMASGWKEGARQLAARAYLKASYNIENKNAKEVYLKRTAFALHHQFTSIKGSQFEIDDLELLYIEELSKGEQFFEEIRLDELGWISKGLNPEKEFEKKYYAEPKLGERLQTGSRKKGGKSGRYLTDTLIGTVIDFRSMEEFTEPKNARTEELVDSLISNTEEKNEKIEDGIHKRYADKIWKWLIGLFFLVAIGVWVLKRKN